MGFFSLAVTFLCTVVLPVLLFLVTVKLWEIFMIRGRDSSCPRPLPPGTMGIPFLGETLQLILQVSPVASLCLSRVFKLNPMLYIESKNK